ncbi:Tannase/feruloyl esterase [Amylocarpus encephaloides]|uniref:Carboxylic ester hydrolase n=1 Tax=Amylocarpus encephaloides TaxID=45428 RepID=A0A9P7YC83_9HELO|nr:Tannase/feruloyl esterase [Amylocarpus encephaloides]
MKLFRAGCLVLLPTFSTALPSRDVSPAPVHACSGPSFKQPEIAGAQILSITAREFLAYSIPSIGLTNLNFCEVNVAYTHPGMNDTVQVQIWLPLNNYNSRFQGVGGGGYAATLGETGLGPAVAEGYATAATDSGTDSMVLTPAGWAFKSPGVVNYDLVRQWAYTSLNELPIIGKAITESFYCSAPVYSYWTGCSNGGRQGLITAQRYPEHYDGILANAPAMLASDWLPAAFWGQIVASSLPGPMPSACEFDAITAASVKACDGLDKVMDGVLSALDLCTFNPQTLVGQSFHCSTTNTTQTFTSKAATIVQKIWEGPTTPNGTSLWNGYSKDAAIAALVTDIGQPGAITLATTWMQYFVTKNPSLDVSTMTLEQFYSYFTSSVAEYSELADGADPNLSPFKHAGGKMLTWHGSADSLIPVENTIRYYRDVEKGDEDVRDYYRFFVAQGIAHCSGGAGYYPTGSFDALVQWVEKGVEPERLTGTSMTGREQPLCVWPLVARWDGVGDEGVAGSYSCAETF